MRANKVKFSIDTDLSIDYQDAGPWRGYQLTAQGNTPMQFRHSATISEIDQDGGELASYEISDAPNSVQDKALKVLENVIKNNS